MGAPFTTAFGFCEYVEAELGWVVPSETPERRRKALVAECAKVKRRMEKDPAYYSWDNLAVTVAYLKARHRTVSPWSVLGYVQMALNATRRRTSRPADIATAIAGAVAREQHQRLDGWQDWVRRLTRAQGAGREEVFEEWERERENPG